MFAMQSDTDATQRAEQDSTRPRNHKEVTKFHKPGGFLPAQHLGRLSLFMSTSITGEICNNKIHI